MQFPFIDDGSVGLYCCTSFQKRRAWDTHRLCYCVAVWLGFFYYAVEESRRMNRDLLNLKKERWLRQLVDFYGLIRKWRECWTRRHATPRLRLRLGWMRFLYSDGSEVGNLFLFFSCIKLALAWSVYCGWLRASDLWEMKFTLPWTWTAYVSVVLHCIWLILVANWLQIYCKACACCLISQFLGHKWCKSQGGHCLKKNPEIVW